VLKRTRLISSWIVIALDHPFDTIFLEAPIIAPPHQNAYLRVSICARENRRRSTKSIQTQRTFIRKARALSRHLAPSRGSRGAPWATMSQPRAVNCWSPSPGGGMKSMIVRTSFRFKPRFKIWIALAQNVKERLKRRVLDFVPALYPTATRTAEIIRRPPAAPSTYCRPRALNARRRAADATSSPPAP
jgi:hypothetical protein